MSSKDNIEKGFY